MEDSGFQIVQKKDGQFGLVKLESVKKTSSKFTTESKIKRRIHRKDCECILCCPKLRQCSTNDAITIRNNDKMTPRFSELKDYSRVRNNEVKPTLIYLKKYKDAAVNTVTADASETTKTEPELDIVDEDEGLPETQIKEFNVEERLVPTGDHVIVDNKPMKIVQKLPKATTSNTNPEAPNRPLLLQLTKENIKCNVCGMIFLRSNNQVKTLRSHFLQHKCSVVKVVQKYTGAKFRTDTPDEKMKSSRTSKEYKIKFDSRLLQHKTDVSKDDREYNGKSNPPVILNSKFKNSKQIKIIPVVGSYSSQDGMEESESSQFPIEPPRKPANFPDAAKLPRILRHRKLVNVKPMPRNLLQQFISGQSKHEVGKSHVIIGSTLIKPIKQTIVIQSDDGKLLQHSSGFTEISKWKQSDEAAVSDADDDVEIVEQTPELIVIDDNDE